MEHKITCSRCGGKGYIIDPKHKEDEARQAEKMLKTGMTFSQIAKKLGYGSGGSVHYLIKKYRGKV